MNVEIARRRSTIEMIEVSMGRFSGNLSDDRKVRLFKMDHMVLKKLAKEVAVTKTGIKATSLIVAAIADSEKDRRVPELPVVATKLQTTKAQPAKLQVAKSQTAKMQAPLRESGQEEGARNRFAKRPQRRSGGVPRRPK